MSVALSCPDANAPTICDDLAAFALDFDIAGTPADVVERSRICLLNSLGMALAGLRAGHVAVAQTAALAIGGGTVVGGAVLLAGGRQATIAGACLGNAALFHARAQDDSCGAAHFGTALVPLVLALIEARDLPVERLLPALIVGYEVGGALEQLYAAPATCNGFRASTIFGTLAAAAAAGRLMGFTRVQIAAAIGCAASLSGGLMHSAFAGTDEWRYQIGAAAFNGFVAAELVAAGAQASPHALEGAGGFIRAFAGPGPMTRPHQLGLEWSLHRTELKPYPVCAFNQSPVSLALALREQAPPDTIERLTVTLDPVAATYPGLANFGPFSTLAGTLLSLPFCVASALVHGCSTLALLTAFDDPRVRELIGRIDIASEPALPAKSVQMRVVRHDGSVLQVGMDRVGARPDSRHDVFGRLSEIIRQESLPQASLDMIATFVDRLPAAPIALLHQAFAIAREA